ncbi:MAG: 30S ribosomal protein S1 [Deltaproteobacteria bacterium]|jgi:small subunit ribosomal protein S1|nr:30S ribosomal protein S1 [Deltaproteobacteria bacterium]
MPNSINNHTSFPGSEGEAVDLAAQAAAENDSVDSSSSAAEPEVAASAAESEAAVSDAASEAAASAAASEAAVSAAASEAAASDAAPEAAASAAAPEAAASDDAGSSDAAPASADDDDGQDLTMEQFYEESLKCPAEGDVLKGVVVQISKEHVMLDVGAKSEGQIQIGEFTDADGKLTVKLGDQVEALLVRMDDDDGAIILSKEKAAKIKIWDEIARVHNEDGIISGVIESRVKGGLAVNIGVQAFLPGSQVDTRPIKNLESLVGKTYDFKVLKYNKRRGNVVLSRRVILEAERELIRSKTMATLEVGAVIEGSVKNLTEYGAFIELGGLDGLLHVTDMSWGRLSHPSDLLTVGAKLTVKVLAFDKDRGRVSLGLKQLQEDPWLSVPGKYNVGDKVRGKVVSLTEYGAFVQLERGLEGLIHVSEMSWTRKVRNPASVLKVGDVVESVILNMDLNAKRISLGMKQVEPNPWVSVAERYPIGTIIEGKIKNITEFGAFIGIDEGIDGLIHISDISWTRRFKHPSEVFKKGDSVRALILAIDREQERFSLGIKQLEEDPWVLAFSNYPVGSVVTGKVTSITDFGVFIQLSEGVEGLVHVSESGLPKGKPLSEGFTLGDEVTAKVVSVSSADHKIGLSIKRLLKDDDSPAKESELPKSHVGQSSSPAFGAAFGDLDKLLAEKKQSNDSEVGN